MATVPIDLIVMMKRFYPLLSFGLGSDSVVDVIVKINLVIFGKE